MSTILPPPPFDPAVCFPYLDGTKVVLRDVWNRVAQTTDLGDVSVQTAWGMYVRIVADHCQAAEAKWAQEQEQKKANVTRG
jgi:hypothetical protein